LSIHQVAKSSLSLKIYEEILVELIKNKTAILNLPGLRDWWSHFNMRVTACLGTGVLQVLLMPDILPYFNSGLTILVLGRGVKQLSQLDTCVLSQLHGT
jgi:hypothetical protein